MRQRQYAEWKPIKKQALDMYGKRCMLCNIHCMLPNGDHILPYKEYPTFALDIHNVQVLCEHCNLLKDNNRVDFRSVNEKELCSVMYGRRDVALKKAMRDLMSPKDFMDKHKHRLFNEYSLQTRMSKLRKQLPKGLVTDYVYEHAIKEMVSVALHSHTNQFMLLELGGIDVVPIRTIESAKKDLTEDGIDLLVRYDILKRKEPTATNVVMSPDLAKQWKALCSTKVENTRR